MNSMLAYVDSKTLLQYPMSGSAVRTLMKCPRRMTLKDGFPVNFVALGIIHDSS